MTTSLVELTVGPVAHGGHCVARLEGRVVFVRYALPGERVLARIIDSSQRSYWRAEAVTILEAAPDRVNPPCAAFGPGGCGGCDLLHLSPAAQRTWKAAVVTEQLARLAGVDWSGQVEPLPGPDGRIRVRWAAHNGAVGPRRWHSHEVVAMTEEFGCLMADPAVVAAAVAYAGPDGEVTIVQDADRHCAVTPTVPDRPRRTGRGHRGKSARRANRPGPADQGDVPIRQLVLGREFAMSPTGFWQAHPAAPEVFVQAVIDICGLTAGDTAWDLYGGVGLFAAFLAEVTGPTGQVVSVESNPMASKLARRNLVGLAATAQCGQVERVLPTLPRPVRTIVLDPPRAGAGRTVCTQLAAAEAERIIYLACDPAALARDIGLLGQYGYTVSALRAFDAFPATHHVECLAVLQR